MALKLLGATWAADSPAGAAAARSTQAAVAYALLGIIAAMVAHGGRRAAERALAKS